MFLIKLYEFSLVLSCLILYTKADTNTKKHRDMIDKLLMSSGWTNLNDLYCINYYEKLYYLRNLMETPTQFNKSDQKIRALTIYIGCTYAKMLNNLLLAICSVIQNCKVKIKEKNDIINVCIFTEDLLNIITVLIVPMAKLMKGAMDALDILHIRPWMSGRKTKYILSDSLEKMEDIFETLKEQTLSRDDINTYNLTLNTIDSFFNGIIMDINNETTFYCRFKPFDENHLSGEWLQEYEAIHFKDSKLVYFKFLIRKIQDYIKTVVIEKYFQLGFKFDPITEETVVPTPNELFELELEFKVIDEEPSTLIDTH
ncbi:uncharacterized protein LOC126897073 isoform X2 [Daktulosphaira vitifoliae]|uniref:uncharacterized protein LOC126897073 isoform X2 n=1 Tax=Daktulosphaira vitifoliae TaxID=58002 RepID=UPI0021AA1423|nr:uncharacterized protein LOC126897073 isoform X2 [Daktulosphaira vitifoliae]